MFGAESTLTPNLPGVNSPSPMTAQRNPFQGVRRAGQAKRAQNFEKYSQSKNMGSKNRMAGGDVGTLVGSQSKLF